MAATVVTNTGRAFIAGLMTGDTSKPANYYVAWGTGSTDAAVGDTALQTEAAETRVAASVTRVTTSVSNDTAQGVGTMTCASTGKTISETGLLTAITSGVLLMHANFAGIVLAVGDSIQLTNSIKEG